MPKVPLPMQPGITSVPVVAGPTEELVAEQAAAQGGDRGEVAVVAGDVDQDLRNHRAAPKAGACSSGDLLSKPWFAASAALLQPVAATPRSREPRSGRSRRDRWRCDGLVERMPEAAADPAVVAAEVDAEKIVSSGSMTSSSPPRM